MIGNAFMKRGRPTPVASAFIENDGKFLLVFDPNFQFWRVPGGRLKFKEKIEDALSREIKEELGIDIKIEKYLGFGQDNAIVRKNGGRAKITSRFINYFLCKPKSLDIKFDSGEVSNYKWLTIDEMKKIKKLEPAMLDFFKRFKI